MAQEECFFIPYDYNLCEIQSQNYVMTDGQSVSLTWCQAPIWGPRPDFYTSNYQNVADLLVSGAVSDERTSMSFTIDAGPRKHSSSRVQPRGTPDHIVLSQIRDSPNLKGQVPVFISPRNN
jgi:hypothetical protein